MGFGPIVSLRSLTPLPWSRITHGNGPAPSGYESVPARTLPSFDVNVTSLERKRDGAAVAAGATDGAAVDEVCETSRICAPPAPSKPSRTSDVGSYHSVCVTPCALSVIATALAGTP